MSSIGESIIVKSDGARDGAKQILTIVTKIEQTMNELNESLKKNIPERVETQWSDTLRSNWQKYYTGDIPETMNAMKLSASNIQMAVEAAEAYSNMQ